MIENERLIGLDIETSNGFGQGSLDARDPNSFIALMQFSFDGVDEDIRVMRAEEGMKLLGELNTPGTRFIIHNAFFELDWFLHKYDFPIHTMKVWCPMTASQIINAGKNIPDKASWISTKLNKKNIEYLGKWDPLIHEEIGNIEEVKTAKFTHNLQATVYRYANGVVVEKDQGNSDWANPNLTEEQLRYARDDVRYLIEIARNQWEFVKKFGLERVIDLELSLIPATVDMKKNGMKIDTQKWEESASDYKSKALELEEKLNTEMGMELARREGSMSLFGNLVPRAFNVSSSSQVASYFNLPSADESHLRELVDKDPIVKDILEFKEYSKIASTYGKNYLKFVDDRDSRIHSMLVQTETATGRFSSRRPNLQNCYSKDTEILTDKGWIRVDRLTENEKVAQYDKNSEIITFVKPTGYTKYFENELIHIESTQIDLFVTKDHRVLGKNRKTGAILENTAENYFLDAHHITSGYYEGGNSVLDENFLRFLVAVQADGHYRGKTDIDFTFRKDRKVDTLHSILENLGYKFFSRQKGETLTRITVYGCQNDVKNYLGEEKTFGTWVFNLTRALIDTVLDEIMMWDGLSTRKSNYSSNNENNVDLVQALFSISNRRARKRIYKTSTGNNNYQIDVPTNKNRRFVNTSVATRTKHPYNDYVYCVTVPSSYVLVRRNGKTSISGNCPAPMLKSFINYDPGTVLLTVDYSSMESRILAYAADDEAFIKAVNSEDVHWENAKNIFKLPENASKKDVFYVDAFKKNLPGDELRRMAKGVSFGIPYGISAIGLVSRGFAENESQGQELIDGFLNQYPNVKRFLDRAKAEGLFNGYTQDPFGRIRWHQKPKRGEVSDDEIKKIEAAISRRSQNHKIQSCVIGDTYVFAKGIGYTKIKNLENKPIEIWDGQNYSLATVIKTPIKKKRVTIQLNSNFKISCSEDHKFLCVSSQGYKTWKTPREMKENSTRIVLSDSVGKWEWFDKDTDLPECIETKSWNASNQRLEDFCENLFDLGVFLGRLASDGTVTPDRLTLLIAQHEIKIKEKLEKFLKKFKYVAHREVIKEGYTLPVHTLTISDKKLASQVKALNLKQDVPVMITKSYDMLRGYMQGLFDGDGTVTPDGRIILTFGKQEHKIKWAHTIQQLLLLFGIESSVRTYEGDRTVVNVRKRSNKVFMEKIGFLNDIKSNKVKYNATFEKSKNFGLARRVKKIHFEEEEVEMYDVMNSETSKFLANGMVVHNCSANITKMAIKDLYYYLKDTNYGKMVLTIHDSIFFELNEESAEVSIPEIVRIMEESGPKVFDGMIVPVDADVGVKETRICDVSGLKFSVYSHIYENGKIQRNLQNIEPRIFSLLDGKFSNFMEARTKILSIIAEKDDKWRSENADIVKIFAK